MKKTLKILSVSLLMMILMLTSCYAEELELIDEYEGVAAEEFVAVTEEYISSLLIMEEEEINSAIEEADDQPETQKSYENLIDLINSEQEFVAFESGGLYKNADDELKLYQLIEFTDKYYVFSTEFEVDFTTGYVYYNTFEFSEVSNYKPGDEIPEVFNLDDYEFGNDEENAASSLQFVFDKEVLLNAAGNTLIGLGVVFGALIFISLIISLFKYISPEGRNFKAAPVKEPVVTKTDKNIGTKKNIENDNELVAAITAAVITDETQLVAAITAAISAYEGVSADTFVVRTIKKRKW